MKRSSKVQLAIALVLCFISVLFAGIIQTDFGRVEMTELVLETPGGTLTGYLYKPERATVDHPAPAVIASHGYLNNREMQDLNALELARRGYVVVAMNAYGHGDSAVAAEDYSDSFAVKSGGMIEFVEYVATLPYVDASRIGVTGHSMGGGYTNTTMEYYSNLEHAALLSGYTEEEAHLCNLINTGVIIGNYPSNLLDYESGHVGYRCHIGVILAKYDEFFGSFGKDLLSSGNSKDIIRYQTGENVILDIEEGRFYQGEHGYGIAFYNPTQFHATNHFSYTVVRAMLDIFEKTMPAPRTISSADQLWIWKAIFNLIGLIGFFLFIVPFADLLMNMRFFSELRCENPTLAPAMTRSGGYVLKSLLLALLCFLLTVPLLLLGYVLLINRWLPQDTTGGIGLWCIGCGLLTLAFIGGRKKRKNGVTLSIGKTRFWKTLLLALLTVACTYLLVFLADYVNQTDFRFWTLDIRVFSAPKIWVAIKYLPMFFVFYLFNSWSIARSSYNNWSEKKQMTVCALWNILPPLLVLMLTYLPTPFLGQTFWNAILSDGGSLAGLLQAAMALIPILMIPFVPLLAIAACISVRLYRKTGTPWLGALINAMLITMITVANTSFSFAY